MEFQIFKILWAALKNKLDLIAITDHNSPGMYESIASAAKDRNLTVLPGTEITIPQGARNIHLLAIFPPNKSNLVRVLLNKIGINDLTSQPSQASTKTTVDILDEIHDLGGLGILAHVDGESGLDSELKGNSIEKQRILKHKHLAGIEVVFSPAEDGSDVLEPSGGGYVRFQTAPADWNGATLADPSVATNANAFTWVKATATYLSGAKIGYMVAYDASAAGNYLGAGPLGTAKPVLVDDTPDVAAGAGSISLD